MEEEEEAALEGVGAVAVLHLATVLRFPDEEEWVGACFVLQLGVCINVLRDGLERRKLTCTVCKSLVKPSWAEGERESVSMGGHKTSTP